MSLETGREPPSTDERARTGEPRTAADEELADLIELLARQAETVWTAARAIVDPSAAGSAAAQVGPEPLPSGAERWGRAFAQETVRTILDLGYRIQRPQAMAETAADSSVGAEADLAAEIESLRSSRNPDLASLLALWRARDPERWSRSALVYQLLADRLLRLGEPLLAYDVTGEGLQSWPQDVRLRQLQALGLARSGVAERANLVLRELYEEGHVDEETLGLLARTHKDLGLRATDPAESRDHLLRSEAVYAEAYERHGGYWSGINAASLSVVLGGWPRARTLAQAVLAQCRAELDRIEAAGGDAYWVLATLGEAALVLGDVEAAEQWYLRASSAGRGRLGDLASTRRNARLLLDHVDVDRERIERSVRVPPVAVFTGHMIDQPDRPEPRFPAELEGAVATSLRERLAVLGCGVGYASAAPGADVLFLEALRDLGGETNVVLPYDAEQFLKDIALATPGTGWAARCERALTLAARVTAATEQRGMLGAATYDYGNLVLHGLAAVRAEDLGTELVPIAVWDGRPGDGPGGTASMVRRWQARGLDVQLVNPANLRAGRELPSRSGARHGSHAPASSTGGGQTTEAIPSQTAVLLFADAVGFSKLTEDQVPPFAEHFLGAIGKLIAATPYAPSMRNTWGDGLFFVFSNVRDAGLFALDLCDLVNQTPWSEKGLPPSLSLRMGLHVGPVFRFLDPISRRRNYLGTHVSRAARIEPVTPPGHVYASQAFAALAAGAAASELRCEYVGLTPLAKGYGTFPTFHLRRRS